MLRLLLEIDGEIVISRIPDVGFLHTGIEKTAEDIAIIGSIDIVPGDVDR